MTMDLRSTKNNKALLDAVNQVVQADNEEKQPQREETRNEEANADNKTNRVNNTIKDVLGESVSPTNIDEVSAWKPFPKSKKTFKKGEAKALWSSSSSPKPSWNHLQSLMKTHDFDYFQAMDFWSHINGRPRKALDKNKFPVKAGLEGPFSFKSGRVLYYDARKGEYYDSTTDIYLGRGVMPEHVHNAIMDRIDEAKKKKVKVELNPKKKIGYTIHDVGPGGKKTLVKKSNESVNESSDLQLAFQIRAALRTDKGGVGAYGLSSQQVSKIENMAKDVTFRSSNRKSQLNKILGVVRGKGSLKEYSGGISTAPPTNGGGYAQSTWPREVKQNVTLVIRNLKKRGTRLGSTKLGTAYEDRGAIFDTDGRSKVFNYGKRHTGPAKAFKSKISEETLSEKASEETIAASNQIDAALKTATPYMEIFPISFGQGVNINGSFQPKQLWPRNIWRNSQYFSFSVEPKGVRGYSGPAEKWTVQLITGNSDITKPVKFRKFTGPLDKVILKVKTWIDSARSYLDVSESVDEDALDELQFGGKKSKNPIKRVKKSLQRGKETAKAKYNRHVEMDNDWKSETPKYKNKAMNQIRKPINVDSKSVKNKISNIRSKNEDALDEIQFGGRLARKKTSIKNRVKKSVKRLGQHVDKKVNSKINPFYKDWDDEDMTPGEKKYAMRHDRHFKNPKNKHQKNKSFTSKTYEDHEDHMDEVQFPGKKTITQKIKKTAVRAVQRGLAGENPTNKPSTKKRILDRLRATKANRRTSRKANKAGKVHQGAKLSYEDANESTPLWKLNPKNTKAGMGKFVDDQEKRRERIKKHFNDLAKKKGRKTDEEADNVQELKKDTYLSYADKAGRDAIKRSNRRVVGGTSKSRSDYRKKQNAKVDKRLDNMDKAIWKAKQAKEEKNPEMNDARDANISKAEQHIERLRIMQDESFGAADAGRKAAIKGKADAKKKKKTDADVKHRVAVIKAQQQSQRDRSGGKQWW